LASSNSEARRLVQQGAVSINDEKISDPKAQVEVPEGAILKAGKRKFAKIISA
jgi:tyrosyl-tRNA synthetase